jgi:NAD(P)-dependent dehydrogenase (short-subunit alcohol dehydrogenase family)
MQSLQGQSLEGKVALVTAAAGGLGSAVTHTFLEAGAKVAGVSRHIKPGQFQHPNFTAVPADLSSGEAARQVVAQVVAQLGRVDALIHVMGGFAGGQSVAETDDATMDQMLDLNFRSGFFMARAVIPQMRLQASGRILVVASRQGAEPGAMVGAYSASKAAIIALVKAIALENKDAGITANTVLPGAMGTPGNSGKTLVPTEQVAALLAHLAGDAAAQITGAAIPIYGAQL